MRNQNGKIRPFTIKDAKNLLEQLKSENNPENTDLIAFYTKKIETETAKATKRLILSN